MFSNDLMTKDLYPGYKENTQNAITKKKNAYKNGEKFEQTLHQRKRTESKYFYERMVKSLFRNIK